MIPFDGQTPRMIYGEGVSLTISGYLDNLNVKNVMVVYDAGVKSAGLIDPIVNALKEKGYNIAEYDGVVPDPTVEVIENGARLAKDAGVEAFIGVGGGSALDATKCMALLQSNPGSLLDYMGVGVAKNACPPWIAVPTTSGTGSEVTALSIITDAANERKVMVKDLIKMKAAVAYLDPTLLTGLPKGLTAATGVDALTHAIEGFTIPRSNEFSDLFAVGAIKRIMKYLPLAVKNGKDLEARGQMLIAASYGGLAFANASLHIGHAIAHGIGASLHVPHGIACAWGARFSIRQAGQSMPYGRLQTLAQTLGIDIIGLERAELIRACEDVVAALIRQVGIPTPADMKLGEKDKMELAFKTTWEKEQFMSQASGTPIDEATMRSYFEEIWAQ